MSSSSLLRLFLVGLAALTVCLSAAPAFAGEEEAKEFYSQAKDAYQAGEFAKAADLLERAYAEDPNLIYQYNRVLALQGMEEYREALRVLEIYENPMKEDGRFDDVAEIRAQLEKSIAEQGAEAEEKEDTDPDTDTGTSDETATTGGTDTGTTGAAQKDMTVSDTAKRNRVIGWSLAGAGVASAIIGFPFYTEIALNNKLENDPSANEDEVRSNHQVISAVTLVSAAVLGGVGGYFLYRGYSDDGETATSASRATRAVVTPYFTADGGGGAVILRF